MKTNLALIFIAFIAQGCGPKQNDSDFFGTPGKNQDDTIDVLFNEFKKSSTPKNEDLALNQESGFQCYFRSAKDRQNDEIKDVKLTTFDIGKGLLVGVRLESKSFAQDVKMDGTTVFKTNIITSKSHQGYMGVSRQPYALWKIKGHSQSDPEIGSETFDEGYSAVHLGICLRKPSDETMLNALIIELSAIPNEFYANQANSTMVSKITPFRAAFANEMLFMQDTKVNSQCWTKELADANRLTRIATHALGVCWRGAKK